MTKQTSTNPPKETETTARTSNAEVTDLIERLSPLAKDPRSWYGGLEISFSGTDVSIKLKTKDDNEYNGTAKTLKEAVARITDPSSTIRDALRGWGEREQSIK